MALFSIDLGALFDLIKKLLGPFGKVLDAGKQLYDHVVGILDAAEKLKDSIIGEITAWKTFKQDIRLRQRVVNLESAIEKTRDLIEGIPEAWRSIQDLVKQFKKQVSSENPVEDTEAIVEDIESGGIKDVLAKFPRLAKVFEKLLGVLAILLQAAEAIANGIDDVQQIVDEFKRLRLEVERLDTIFLQQANKRKTLRLADGSKIKIRVGNLHPA
jgi:hypothetical protein